MTPGKRILVVGGAGYIGSHMVKALGDAGHDTTVYDNLSAGKRDAILGGDFVEGDLADTARLDALFSSQRFDAVMHFAGSIQVGESVANPGLYYRNNVASSLNLLSAMTRHGVRHIVFSSTAAIFGEPQRIPIDESHPTLPLNPYGRSKPNNYLGLTLLAQGKVDEALAVVQQQTNERERQKLLPVFLAAAGLQAEADKAQNVQTAIWGANGAYFVAATLASRGDLDGAMEWLERAYSQKDGWLSWILGERLFRSMADDPRFIEFLKKMNLPTDPLPVNWQ